MHTHVITHCCAVDRWECPRVRRPVRARMAGVRREQAIVTDCTPNGILQCGAPQGPPDHLDQVIIETCMGATNTNPAVLIGEARGRWGADVVNRLYSQLLFQYRGGRLLTSGQCPIAPFFKVSVHRKRTYLHMAIERISGGQVSYVQGRPGQTCHSPRCDPVEMGHRPRESEASRHTGAGIVESPSAGRRRD